MRIRLRLGAAMAVGLGALLLATALASPAFAWDASVEVKAKCLDNGDVGVKYVVSAWEAGHKADVSASYSVNGGTPVSRPGGELDENGKFVDHFVLPAGTTGKVVVEATVTWKDSDEDAVNVKQVGAELDLEYQPTYRRVKMAEDAGYLHNLEDRRGKPARIVVGDPMPKDVELLPGPEELEHLRI